MLRSVGSERITIRWHVISNRGIQCNSDVDECYFHSCKNKKKEKLLKKLAIKL